MINFVYFKLINYYVVTANMESLYCYITSYYNQYCSDVETVGTIKTTIPPKRGIASFQKNNRVFTSTGFSAVLFIQNATQVNDLNTYSIHRVNVKYFNFTVN